MKELIGFLVAVIVLIVLVALYFLPGMIAYRRNHINATPIALLNVFLGWTFFGWVIALIWANTDRRVN